VVSDCSATFSVGLTLLRRPSAFPFAVTGFLWVTFFFPPLYAWPIFYSARKTFIYFQIITRALFRRGTTKAGHFL
jgi:hypothetical protein